MGLFGKSKGKEIPKAAQEEAKTQESKPEPQKEQKGERKSQIEKKQSERLSSQHGIHGMKTIQNLRQAKKTVFEKLNNQINVLDRASPAATGISEEELVEMSKHVVELEARAFAAENLESGQVEAFGQIHRELITHMHFYNDLLRDRSQDISKLMNRLEDLRKFDKNLNQLKDRRGAVHPDVEKLRVKQAQIERHADALQKYMRETHIVNRKAHKQK